MWGRAQKLRRRSRRTGERLGVLGREPEEEEPHTGPSEVRRRLRSG